MSDDTMGADVGRFDLWAVAWLASFNTHGGGTWAAAWSAAVVASCVLVGWVIGQAIGRRLLAWCEARRLGAGGE